jgi:hypothetical protein
MDRCGAADLMRILIGVLLALEGLSTGVATISRVQSFAVYPAAIDALFALRGVVGVLQFASGWMLVRNAGPGRPFARVALLASACLLTLELGFALAPTSVFPTFRWPVVVAYWIYAIASTLLLRVKANAG